MDKIMLKAEALFGGSMCPVCGDAKTEKARTCRSCLKKIGSEATHAVDRVAEMMCDALFGNAAANAGNVVRGNIWGKPVLANIKLDRDSIFYPAKGEIEAYWECRRTIRGRFVSIFIFGLGEDAENGREISGLVELKVKSVKGAPIHYLRMQFVKGVKSDVKLAVLNFEERTKLNDTELGLPSHMFGDQRYGFAIGFLPAVKPQRNTEACAG